MTAIDSITRNPNWSREEHVLGIDLYLRLRHTSFPENHPDVIALSDILRRLAIARGVRGNNSFRNPTGVSMKMMNFRRFDDTKDSRGLAGGSGLEKSVWDDFSQAPHLLATEVAGIMRQITQAEVNGSSGSGSEAMNAAITELEVHLVQDVLDTIKESQTIRERSSDAGFAFDRLAKTELQFLEAAPEAKSYLSDRIERGPVGQLVKRVNKFHCQLCEQLGQDPIGFRKRNGEPYVEAHHVMPVHRREIGSLSASNVVTLCANHHREVHYGDLTIEIGETHFTFIVGDRRLDVKRTVIAQKA